MCKGAAIKLGCCVLCKRHLHMPKCRCRCGVLWCAVACCGVLWCAVVCRTKGLNTEEQLVYQEIRAAGNKGEGGTSER
jgi:hypothetical protein